jgi:hypothetical protein
MNKAILNNAQSQRRMAARVVSSGEVELLDVQVRDQRGQSRDTIVSGAALNVVIRIRLHSSLERPEFHVGTHTTDFVYVTGDSSALDSQRPDFQPGEHEISLCIASFTVRPGVYGIRFAVLDKVRRVLFHGEMLHMFSVVASKDEALQDELRLVELPASWSFGAQRALVETKR